MFTELHNNIILLTAINAQRCKVELKRMATVMMVRCAPTTDTNVACKQRSSSLVLRLRETCFISRLEEHKFRLRRRRNLTLDIPFVRRSFTLVHSPLRLRRKFWYSQLSQCPRNSCCWAYCYLHLVELVVL